MNLLIYWFIVYIVYFQIWGANTPQHSATVFDSATVFVSRIRHDSLRACRAPRSAAARSRRHDWCASTWTAVREAPPLGIHNP